MHLAPIVLACLAAFALAYVLYGRWLGRLLRLDPHARTPAHARADGADYVPTPKLYLLAQHFSAISAAGPIAGPILACLAFGWQPALVWIVLGCIFIGALHDFAALTGSLRHGAGSVAEILRVHVGGRAWALFSLYIWLALVYVIIAFTDITARAFVETLHVELPGREGALVVRGAGIASSSLAYLALGLLLGLALRYLRLSLRVATLVFVPLVGAAIALGPSIPLELIAPGPIPALWWAWAILAYCALASMLPVWLLLQPRGYLGGFFLYVALGGGLLGLLVLDPLVAYPSFKGFLPEGGQPLVPFLFITIACGACSGFHGLVCSGTTSKQIACESDARLVGYGGMLLEGVMALLALACVMWLGESSPVAGLNPDKIFGFGVGSFLAALGLPLQFAVGFGMLAFATFVYDTLDVCTRLARYLFQEFTGWRGRAGAWAGTLVSLALPAWVVSQTVVDGAGRVQPAYRVIWPLFGSSNQLLAALTLLALLLWLVRARKPRVLQVLVGLPMLFMMGMTLAALWLQITDARSASVLVGVAVALFALALWVAAEGLWALARGPRAAAGPEPAGP
jgi:carbon starvation protein